MSEPENSEKPCNEYSLPNCGLPVIDLCNKDKPPNCGDTKGKGPLGKRPRGRDGTGGKDEEELVRTLQRMLKTLGYDVGSSGLDGKFGEDTKNAVIEFQRDKRYNKDWKEKQLDDDGLVGPRTADALNRAMVGVWYEHYQTPEELTKDTLHLTITKKAKIIIARPHAKKAKLVVIKRPKLAGKTIVQHFIDSALVGAPAGGYGVIMAEKVFYFPQHDPNVLIAEGPARATSWEGYHAGKHGVFERFMNMQGNEVNMGRLLFNEEWRYIKSEFKNPDGSLKYISDADARTLIEAAYKDPGAPADLSGIFDSKKFTKDVAEIYQRAVRNPKSTVWQGKYVYVDRQTGKPTGKLGPLQTNVDFRMAGHRWRVAIDAKTGQPLNFFKIDEGPPMMKYAEIVVKWKSNVTDVTQYTVSRGGYTVSISATWKGLLLQGIKEGAKGGAIVGGFLGAIDGFRKDGLPGVLKGLAVGIVAGGIGGALVGGVVSLASRILPWVGRVVKIGGLIVTVAVILLEPSETGRDAPEFFPPQTDKDGNVWYYRNMVNEGSTFFPDRQPHGVKIVCTDKTIIEFGKEKPWQIAYSGHPIQRYALTSDEIKWLRIVTPEGSDIMWWQDSSGSQHVMTLIDSTYHEDASQKFDMEKTYHILTGDPLHLDKSSSHEPLPP